MMNQNKINEVLEIFDAYWSIDAESELMIELSKEIANEIDNEILKELMKKETDK